MGELVHLPGVTALPDGGGVFVTKGQEVEEIPDLEQGLHIVLKRLVGHTCTCGKKVLNLLLLFIILARFNQNKQINMIRVLAFLGGQFLFTLICIQITGTNYLSYSKFYYIQLAHYFLWLITYWYEYINLIKLLLPYLFHGDKFSIHSYTNTLYVIIFFIFLSSQQICIKSHM